MLKSIKKSGVFVIASFALSSFAVAEVPSLCHESMPVVERISCLQAENALLKELIQRKKLAEEVNEDGNKFDNAPKEIPVVATVFGTDERDLTAIIFYPESGGKMVVKKGDRLPDGSVVTSITKEGKVTLAHGKKKTVLLLDFNSVKNNNGGDRNARIIVPDIRQQVLPNPSSN